MSSSVIRIAPSRDCKQVASAWRFWSQGDEFYAAARDFIRLGKVSFHRNGNWQYRIGSGVARLARPRSASNGWLHALQIAFVIEDDVLTPISPAETSVVLIETPPSHKLLLDLFLSDEPGSSYAAPPYEAQGAVLHRLRLRGGRTVHVVRRVRPTSARDHEVVSELRKQLSVTLKPGSRPENLHAELVLQRFSHTEGNLLQVVPVSPQSVIAGGASDASLKKNLLPAESNQSVE